MNPLVDVTASKLENDGRQWYAVEFKTDGYGVDAGVHEYALCSDGTIVDCDGCPTTGYSVESAVRDAIERAQ